jgi:hypothetical protein
MVDFDGVAVVLVLFDHESYPCEWCYYPRRITVAG